jgi:hypothetical protein
MLADSKLEKQDSFYKELNEAGAMASRAQL